MAIANPILTTAVTTGATISSLSKLRDGMYSVAGAGTLMTLSLKAATIGGKQKQIQLVLKSDKSLADAPSAYTSGKCSGLVSFAFTPGSVMTDTVARNTLKELGSLLCQDSIIDALIAGSYA